MHSKICSNIYRKADKAKRCYLYEFFWYGCPHCFNLEPTIDRIESNLDSDTKVVKVPVALRDFMVASCKTILCTETNG